MGKLKIIKPISEKELPIKYGKLDLLVLFSSAVIVFSLYILVKSIKC